MIRKHRKLEESIRNSKVIDNSLKSNNNILDKVKRLRKTKYHDEVTIDGKADNEIPDTFANIYSELYNQEYGESSDVTMAEIESKINDSEVDKVLKSPLISSRTLLPS